MKLAERIFKRNDYYITSPFGYRKSTIGYVNGFHDGVDYGTNSQKWNQYALEEGKVISCGIDKKFNNAKYVWVEYSRLGFRLLHYHLDSILVSSGQKVDENTILGTTGMTGNATGIHLHLGMKFTNNLKDYVNAEDYDYVPLNKIETSKRDDNKHQVEIVYEKVNARKTPSGEKLGVFVPVGIYDVLNEVTIDGSKWVEINDGVWCCLVDGCYKEYTTEEVDYKKLYEEALEKLNKIKEIL